MINYLIELAVVHVALFFYTGSFSEKSSSTARMRSYLYCLDLSGAGDSTNSIYPKPLFFQLGPAGDDAHGSTVQGSDVNGFGLPLCVSIAPAEICLGL